MKKFFIKNNSIAKKMLIPLSAVLLIQAIWFGCTILWGGTIKQLNKNAFDILNERVINRKNYLQNEMIQRWSNLDDSVVSIHSNVISILKEKQKNIEDISKSSELSMEILNSVSENLIYLLRRNSVTGVFFILNNEEFTQDIQQKENLKYGLYIRDLDPKYNSSDYSDLLIERAPSSIAKKLGIPMDANWRAQFDFSNKDVSAQYDFFYKPFEAAMQYKDVSYKDLGYWNKAFYMNDDDTEIITYSVPLIFEDGTVYGVLGIEITTDYLIKLLPYDELANDKEGAYFLAIDFENDKKFHEVISSGPAFKRLFGEKKIIQFDTKPYYENNYKTEKSKRIDKTAYGCIQYFKLYNTNTPFEKNKWALIGIIEEENLFHFSYKVRNSVLLALLASLLIGIVSTLLISQWFTKPIILLAQQVKKSNPWLPVKLNKINILEIDELASSIENLSESVADSASKLSKVIELTSNSIGAFEYRYDSDKVFYTKKFFHVLKLNENQPSDAYMDKELFKSYMNSLNSYIVEEDEKNHVTIYNLSNLLHKPYWVSIKTVKDSSKMFGVAEDVTMEIEEKKKIEYERDYDILTDLLNRRAFHNSLSEKFENPENLKIAALVMMDLDNLKFVNDTYGHDFGDKYIRCAADILKTSTPDSAIISRVSGDEFYTFLYGYETKEDIRKFINNIRYQMKTTVFRLPDNPSFRIRASAGVSWYPYDSTSYKELIKYADFAMYQIKNTIKGEFNEFDMVSYERDSYLIHKKEELNKFIDNKLVEYYFQPIVDAKTGKVFAYEALMRSKLETLKSPLEILTLARSQSKLYQIEKLTWFQALNHFQKFRCNENECKIFINSIANQMLNEKDITEIEKLYAPYLNRIVIEMTEEERPNNQCMLFKQKVAKMWECEIAMDDFGTGYNGEALLLSMEPQYVKIDISIIKNIDKDKKRQRIVQNLLSYAKERNIKVIAEGIETQKELVFLIENNVDLLQGYFICKPSAVCVEINSSAKEIIQELNK